MGKLNVQCFTCLHSDVCKFKEQYSIVVAAIDKAEIKGDYIRNIPWLSIRLECQYNPNSRTG